MILFGSNQYQNRTKHYVQAKYYMDKANIMMLLLFPEYYHMTPSTGEQLVFIINVFVKNVTFFHPKISQVLTEQVGVLENIK